MCWLQPAPDDICLANSASFAQRGGGAPIKRQLLHGHIILPIQTPRMGRFSEGKMGAVLQLPTLLKSLFKHRIQH